MSCRDTYETSTWQNGETELVCLHRIRIEALKHIVVGNGVALRPEEIGMRGRNGRPTGSVVSAAVDVHGVELSAAPLWLCVHMAVAQRHRIRIAGI
jgi:hypothetical protein